MVFVWNDEFTTGIDFQDAQHRRLVDLINAAAPALAATDSAMRARLGPLLNDLFAYAAEHFKAEESLMDRCRLDTRHVGPHKASHAAFVNELSALRSSLSSDPDAAVESGRLLLRYLISWLTSHILGTDRQMARLVQRVEAGVPAGKAFDMDEPERVGGQQALQDALTQLMGVIAERNRALLASSAQLTAARRELVAANERLEGEVFERTCALKKALEDSKRLQDQLLQSEKMAAIGQLAAGVAHEINNPVGFVSSNLNSLKVYVRKLLDVVEAYGAIEQSLPADDPRREQILAAKRGADLDYLLQDVADLLDESESGLARVKKIVADLKDFSHVNAADWQAADINAGIESTLTVVHNELKYKATVEKTLGDLPPVRCIASQINQIVMNLLVNAAQAIDGMGTIRLATGVDGEQIWIEVADTGKGMTEAVQQRVFEPFFTTKPVGQGTGLGLSITWDIVQKHGGHVDLTSAPGQGTTFRIWLPIAGPATDAASEA